MCCHTGGDERLGLEKVIDLHASAALLGIFMRGNSYSSVFRFERHMVLPKILAQNCPDYRVALDHHLCHSNIT